LKKIKKVIKSPCCRGEGIFTLQELAGGVGWDVWSFNAKD